MAKYASYPSYKDSGVEWLPQLPQHWDVQRNKAMFSLIKKPVGNRSSDYRLLSLTLTGIIPRDMENLKGKMPAEFDTYQEVKPNDLVFCLFDVDETPRTIGLSQLEGMVTGAYSVYRCLSNAHPDYIFYYYFHLDEFKGLRPFYTGLRKVVRPETFSNIKMPAPPVEEQKAIANFLDHETAKIDLLIARQEQLIYLLKEKRQVVISCAVTKGLNPNVLMKDSGEEWLGEVPEHWDVKSIKRLTMVKRGASPRPIDDPKYFDDDGYYSWVRIADATASGGRLRQTTQRLSSLGASLSVPLPAGEMFLSIAGTVGLPCITEIPACIHDGFVYFPELKENKEFLFYIFQAGECYKGLGKFGTQLNLNTDTVGFIKIGVPPREEQDEIVGYIEKQLNKLDALFGKAQEAISLLNEHRTALISAAVTGKIDVRCWQKPYTEAEETAAAVSA